METESPFVNEHESLLLNEIKGLIVNTSRSAAAAQRELKMRGVNVRKHDANPIANFYFYFNNLFYLTRDLIEDDDLRSDVSNWLNVDFVYSVDTTLLIKQFDRGLNLWNRMDDYLFQIGIKDTNKTGKARFPFGYYARLIEE